MLTAPDLATLAIQYAAAKQTTLAAIGTTLFNDHRFFKRLASGADCTTQSAAKASQWLAEHWPSDVPWPDGVPRPTEAREAAE
jgi:hypothetical protein